MIKDLKVLEVKINDRIHQYHCDPMSPLGEIHDVLTVLKNKIVELMQQQDKPKEE